VDFDDRAELLAADPDVYYVTDHYAGYNAVLVRLSRVNSNVLQDLLGMAHKFVTRNAPFASAEAPKGRFKEMKQSLIPRDCPPAPSTRSDFPLSEMVFPDASLKLIAYAPLFSLLYAQREATILRYSVSVKAFRVCVVTLPIDPVDSMNFALASSLGNSEIITASYFPMVKYQA
jgi:hypothetical protein